LRKRSIKTLLVVEDHFGDARLLQEMLKEEGSRTDVIHVESMREAEQYLSGNGVDIILLDLGLPDAQGLEAVQRAHAAAPRVPLVVLTGLDDESLAARTLQEGAQDYLIKGEIDARGLVRALRYAVERKVLEEALFVERERAQVTLNCIGDAVACTDTLGTISFLNLEGEHLTGWSCRDAVGRPMGEVVRILDATTRQPMGNPMYAEVRLGEAPALSPNWVLVRHDRSEIPIEESVAPIRDRGGQAIGAVIVFRDVTAGRAMAMQITHSAQHDYLTGLPNRMLLNDRVTEAIALARRHMQKVAVLFLDLDGFKHINDSLGHTIGDKVLQSIATRLVHCVRDSDTVSRQGGDEFVVLLSEVHRSEDAAVIATKMLYAISQAHSVDQHDLYITTSIGVSVYPDDGVDAETLVTNADTAMYQAKELGRERYQFFTPAMTVRAVERQFIEEGLRQALLRDEFALVYQPKVNLTTRRIAGGEALIRWNHPARGLILPSTFIPVAEDCGLIVPIGRWVLREACRQARAWKDAGLPAITIAVNVSAMEFRDENFLNGVFAIVDNSGLDPGFLELELTESVLMRDAPATETILRALRARGIRVAVDDFGTGYSSLSYLRKFPVDALKIDQSFVRQIIAAPDEPIVGAVINLGRSLNLRVVAEGVEEREEAEFLEALRCDEAQGNYFSRALPPAQFGALLVTGVPEPEIAQPGESFAGIRPTDRRRTLPAGSGGVLDLPVTLVASLARTDRRLSAADRRRRVVDRRVN
jgi:diguanylate cyclase (GGDEF)-like protein/PAS domain S-box-containing protein